ncbi:hypothetical protein [Nannocystis pusilla]|uniref:hypothetical protein n=1 Tax=Nannocystis pusilla TaxID=889268 RepID=UPI003DA4AAB6
MPRKLIAATMLAAVVLALVILVPWPVEERLARHNTTRLVVWAGLVVTLPWLRARRVALLLGLMAFLVSVGDTADATSDTTAWATARLLRGLLGLTAAALVLVSYTRTDVILWSGGVDPPTGAGESQDSQASNCASVAPHAPMPAERRPGAT